MMLSFRLIANRYAAGLICGAICSLLLFVNDAPSEDSAKTSPPAKQEAAPAPTLEEQAALAEGQAALHAWWGGRHGWGRAAA